MLLWQLTQFKAVYLPHIKQLENNPFEYFIAIDSPCSCSPSVMVSQWLLATTCCVETSQIIAESLFIAIDSPCSCIPSVMLSQWLLPIACCVETSQIIAESLFIAIDSPCFCSPSVMVSQWLLPTACCVETSQIITENPVMTSTSWGSQQYCAQEPEVCC